MRITFVLPFASLAGGVRVIATYARFLSAQGHEVCVISRPRRRPNAFKRLLFRFLGFEKKAPKKSDTQLLEFLGNRHIILDRRRPVTAADVPDADAIFATWWDTAVSVAKLPCSKGKKFYIIQDYETFDYLSVKEVIETYSLPLKKIAVSSFIRDQIATNHGIENIEVVPNAVDTDAFDSPQRSKGQPLTVGFLYNATPRKRVELAVEAVSLARQKLRDLRVIAFGSKLPGERVTLPEWVDYRVAPPQSDIPGIYAACDLWLFTSESEGFGLPLLEAMACRTPVLATRAGGAKDVISGRNGKLLPPNAGDFTTEILAFSAMSETEWQAWSQAAYETAHSYTWDDAAHLLMNKVAAELAL
jgi:glycosyltransferase involved in cell wall biosynthesis